MQSIAGLLEPRAARIPGDDVEVVEQRLPEVQLGEHGEVASAESRAARVDQQAADPLVGLHRQMAGDVQVDRALRRIGVVQRRRERADLDLSGVAERRPSERIGGRIEGRVAVLGVRRGHAWTGSHNRPAARHNRSSKAVAASAGQRMAGRAPTLGGTRILDHMRMGPHMMLPGDTDAVKGARLQQQRGASGVGVRPAVPRDHRHLPGDHLRQCADRARAPVRVQGHPRQGHPAEQHVDDQQARRAGRRRGDCRRRAGHRAAVVFGTHRRGPDLRPARRPVRQGAAAAGRLLHPHPDRRAHQPAQQRRHRRPERRHQHAGQRCQQRRRAGHHAAGDVRPRVAAQPVGARGAAAVHHPRQARRQAVPGPGPPADEHQRRDELADGRTVQRRRCPTGEAVRPIERRDHPLHEQGRQGPRHRHQVGDVRAGVLRRPRARRRAGCGGDLRPRRASRGQRRHPDRNARRPRRAGHQGVPTTDRADQRTRRPDDGDGQLRAGVRGARCPGEHHRSTRRGRPRRPQGDGRARQRHVPLPDCGRGDRRLARGAERRGRPRPRPRRAGRAQPGAASRRDRCARRFLRSRQDHAGGVDPAACTTSAVAR